MRLSGPLYSIFTSMLENEAMMTLQATNMSLQPQSSEKVSIYQLYKFDVVKGNESNASYVDFHL